MRHISMALTTNQFLANTKLVTRRLRWKFAKVGDRYLVVEKSQGLKKGEKVKPLDVIEVVSVRFEPLNAMTAEECALEGFSGMHPTDFVKMFCKHMKCKPDTQVTRIEFRRLYEINRTRRPHYTTRVQRGMEILVEQAESVLYGPSRAKKRHELKHATRYIRQMNRYKSQQQQRRRHHDESGH